MSAPPNAIAANATFEFAALNEAVRYREALVREFASQLRGTVVEVGAGIGQITALIYRQPGVEGVVAVEPDPFFCAKLRASVPEATVIEGTAANLQVGLAPNAIVSVNVLEHIEHDADELQCYHRLLSPRRGTLCLFVPARPEIYAPLDRDFGHFRRYTRRELRAKLIAAGFQIVRLRYYNFGGYFAWWLMFRVLKSRAFNASSVRLFDRTIFPIINWIETRIGAPPIGQSLLAIVRA